MFDFLVRMIDRLFARPQHDELLIPVRVEQKRHPLNRR